MTTKPMNPEVKTKWLDALRSGEYKQSEGLLRSDTDEYCCLGILCQIAADEGVISQPTLNTDEYSDRYMYSDGDNRNSMYLSEKVAKWAGLDNLTGYVISKNGAISLSSMNDEGKPFDQIADVIEEYL
jgi:hypothetical protein